MDVKSMNTNLSSLDTKVEPEGPWYGQLPCVCHSNRGCREHNPMQLPIYHNPRLPPMEQKPSFVTRIISFVWNTTCPDAAFESFFEPSEIPSPFYTQLPFDSLSFDTIAPLHPTMPYHLAIYHLDTVRRQLDLDVKVAFIPELSCSGTSSFYPGSPEYTWSNEIYFDNGTFFQKQEVRYVMEQNSCYRSVKLVGCPHTTVSTNRLRWSNDNNGFLNVSSWWTTNSLRDEMRRRYWSSKNGHFARVNVCPKCDSDAESYMELMGHQVHVRFTCYRDLGSATNRSIPKWISLLTGLSIHNRPDEFDLYPRVWRTAKKLGRPDLHVITYRAQNGQFVVDEGKP